MNIKSISKFLFLFIKLYYYILKYFSRLFQLFSPNFLSKSPTTTSGTEISTWMIFLKMKSFTWCLFFAKDCSTSWISILLLFSSSSIYATFEWSCYFDYILVYLSYSFVVWFSFFIFICADFFSCCFFCFFK